MNTTAKWMRRRERQSSLCLPPAACPCRRIEGAAVLGVGGRALEGAVGVHAPGGWGGAEGKTAKRARMVGQLKCL